MFVTCHRTFGQPSNFVGASLEVTRTIRNNKLHFTWGCFVIKTRKRALRPDSFFFQWFWHFSKYFNYNHNLPSYSLFSKCFWWFFYLGVPKGTGIFSFFFFFSLLLSRVTRSCARFALVSVWLRNAEKLGLFCRSRPPQWN